jgi:hypothetical protein
MASTRRLAAILAADVAGYSRLMGTDEEGTHKRLRGHLRDLVDPKIKEHRGRIVKNTGDGMLAEFSSVVDAVRCAVEMQRAMADRNADTVEDKRVTFRVGINLGDVIAEEDDIYGDGANVAARLEALAEPGASASRGWYETRSETSSLIRLRTRENRASRISPGRFGFSRCGPKQWPNCPRQLYPPWGRVGYGSPLWRWRRPERWRS